MTRDRRELLAVALVVIAAAAVRLGGLGAQGLWLDEAYTANLVRGTLAHILHQLQSADDAPPLFYFLEKGMTILFGESEWALRLLPALAGIATVALAWRVGREVSRRVGLISALVFAASSLAVFYSQQARSYSLLHALSMLLLFITLRLKQHPDRRQGAAFVLLALLLLYTHNLALWIVLAAVLTLAPSLLRDRDGRRLGGALALALALGAIPWGLRILGQLGIHEDQNRWIGYWWSRHSLALAPLYSWGAFSNGGGSAAGVPVPAFPPGWKDLRFILWGASLAGVLGTAALCFRIPGITRAVRSDAKPGERSGARSGVQSVTRSDATSSGRSDARANARSDPRANAGRISASDLAGIALLWALLPCLGLLLTSIVITPSYIVGRTDTLALPGFLLLLGIGWSAWSPRWVAPALVSLWVMAGLASLSPFWDGSNHLSKQSDRELARMMAARVLPGDAVILGSLSRPTFEYYAHLLGFADRLVWFGSYPPLGDTAPTASFDAPLDSAAAYAGQALALRNRLETGGTKRVWILALLPDNGGHGGAASGGTPSSAGPARTWPERPTPPPPNRRTVDANGVSYPTNILLAYLVGLGRAESEWEYKQDWVSGDRLVLRMDRASWVPQDSIPKLEFQP